MDQRNNDQRLRRLAAELLNVLTEVPQGREPINQDILTAHLKKSPLVMDMIQAVAHRPALEFDHDEDILNYEELRLKYKELAEEFRHAEERQDDIRAAFESLTGILASLAENSDQPGLDQDLKRVRALLGGRTEPEQLEDLARGLKKYLLQSAVSVEAVKPTEGPEDLIDNVRDILVLLVKDICLFEIQDIQQAAEELSGKIRHEFSLDNYEPFIQEIQSLIYRIKETVHQEKRKIIQFTRDVMSGLEDTEKEFLRTLNSETQRLTEAEGTFAQQIDRDIRVIEQTFDLDEVNFDEIRSRVFDKISSIRERFRRKRDEDRERWQRLEREKAGAEDRLKDIHGRYQEFTRQSRHMLKEMERFRRESMKDGLTGVLNRRAYDLQIRKALTDFEGGRLNTFCLIVYDIDNFRDFNNNHGHRAGDKILAHVARFAARCIRRDDFMFRYGGDEFVILLPEAGLEAASRIAEKIRSGIYGVEFKVYRDHDLVVRVGLSMGVCEVRSGDSAEMVFSRADEALYAAKAAGRNCVRTVT